MAPRNRTLITVDWDSFIPEDINWDIGHAESEMFAGMVWMTRGNLMDKMLTDGNERRFWSRIHDFFAIQARGVTVSDSHLHVYPWLGDIDTVINFDAHHDCWPVKGDMVDCATWGTAWLGKSKARKFIWVVPDWQDPASFSESIDSRVIIKRLSTFEQEWGDLPRRARRVHVCRSGAWTPPWLDRQFQEFIRDSRFEPISFPIDKRGTIWDPMQLRWGEAEYKSARQMHEFSLKVQAEFNERCGNGSRPAR